MGRNWGMSGAAPSSSILHPPMICVDTTFLLSISSRPTKLKRVSASAWRPPTPRPMSEIARQLLALGCRTVVMTLGERGSMIVTADDVIEVPAYDIPNTVDSNGAGDSFNASLATGLLEGMSLPDAARFANAVAGLCCTRWDTVPSYHTRGRKWKTFLNQ